MSVLLDHRGDWTIEDYRRLPEDDTRYELYDGSLLVNPTPVYRHQSVAFRLAQSLDAAAPPDIAVVLSVDVVVPAGVFIPDVLALPRDIAERLEHEFPAREVLLVVEVESPTGRRRDRVLKQNAYAEAGIPSYWRVELRDAAAPVVVQELRDGVYVETARLEPGVRGRIDRPFALELDPAELLS